MKLGHVLAFALGVVLTVIVLRMVGKATVEGYKAGIKEGAGK